MTEINFSASVQRATDWVNRYLIYPSDRKDRPVPNRVDYGWITSIKAGEITEVEAPGPDIKILDRPISFYVGDLLVVRIRMMGIRHYRESRPRYTEWAPSEVTYRLNWSSKEDGTHWEEISSFPTDLSRTIAPSDD